ncbi:MAG: LamG domain-containing protein, partial [Candidatus Bilamarchaeaceae archaeon]
MGSWAAYTVGNVTLNYCRDLSNWMNNVTGAGMYANGPGIYGDAVVMNGYQNYMYSYNASLDASVGFTTAMWVKFTNLKANNTIFSLANLSSNNERFSIFTNIADGQKLYFYGNGVGSTAVSSNFAPANNTWNHVVVTYDGATLSFYINGTLYNSAPLANSGVISGQYFLGARKRTSKSEYFNGSMDEVMVYGRSLSAYEVSQLYRSTLYRDANYSDSYTFYSNPSLVPGTTTSYSGYVQSAADFTTASTETRTVVSLINATLITLGMSPNPAGPGATVTVSGHVNLSNGTSLPNQPITIYLDDVLVDIPGAATDSSGDYSYGITAPDLIGNHNVTVNSTYDSMYGTVNATLSVFNAYDYNFLQDTFVYFPNMTYVEGNSTSFSAMLNVTTNETLNLNVSLIINDSFVNSSIFIFTENETRNVSLGWSVIPGNYTATFALDPGRIYNESNETNNNISISGLFIQKAVGVSVYAPMNNSFIPRGKNAATEDVWRVVDNRTSISAGIYNYFHPGEAVPAVCYFYWNYNYLGSNNTGTNGTCIYSFDHSLYDAGIYHLLVNYSILEENATFGPSGQFWNFTETLNIINATANVLNERADGQYMRGDALITNITVYNDSVPFDPPDFALFIGGAITLNCPSGSLPSESDAWFVMRKSQASSHPSAGSYLMLSVLNDSHDEDVHWCLYVNDSTGAFIASSSHQDVGIDPPTAHLNVSILNASAENLSGASVQLYDRNGYQLENRAITGELYRPAAKFDNYTLIISDADTNRIRFDDFNVSGPSIQVPALFSNGYAGTKPYAGAESLTSLAFITDSSFLNYSNPGANITLLKGDYRVRKVYKCDAYDAAAMNCTSWNSTADYSLLGQNATHVWFTVSGFSGYAAGPDGAN